MNAVESCIAPRPIAGGLVLTGHPETYRLRANANAFSADAQVPVIQVPFEQVCGGTSLAGMDRELRACRHFTHGSSATRK
jgi:hypothetical protein